jgi:enolase
MSELPITDVHAREILDSRGTPTVEVEITCDDVFLGRAIVPSGASTGTHEALELRDGDKKRYFGKGVLNAVENVNQKIRPEILGMNALDQPSLDRRLVELDGTALKERLGANAILGVSMAACRVAAIATGMPLYRYLGGINALKLPVPMMNILNGGKHAANNVVVQEFMILPVGAEDWAEALRWGSEVYHSLREVLSKEQKLGGVGDEGGFAPNLDSNEQALQLIERAIDNAGLVAGEDVFLAFDSAANEFYNEETARYRLEVNEEPMTAEEVSDRYARWVSKHPIISIEDGLSEDDWHGWAYLTKILGDKVQLIGDDIFVTSIDRLKTGIEKNVSNAILIKLNQVGTVTETLNCMRVAAEHNMNCIVSHRSGETEDSFIADFTVGTGAGQIKSGAPARTDRVAKYNQLLRIHDELSEPHYVGKTIYGRWPSPIVRGRQVRVK